MFIIPNLQARSLFWTLNSYLLEISTWITHWHIKLNMSKSILVLALPLKSDGLTRYWSRFTILTSSSSSGIKPQSSNSTYFISYFATVVKQSWFYLLNVSHIWLFHSIIITTTLVFKIQIILQRPPNQSFSFNLPPMTFRIIALSYHFDLAIPLLKWFQLLIAETKCPQNFSVKSQRANIFGSVGLMASVVTTQLCCWNMKAEPQTICKQMEIRKCHTQH